MPRRLRTPAVLSCLVALASLASLTACSAGDYPMHAAPDANNPACADVIVRLPESVAGFERRTTNAQSTGAWGNPAAVLLYCGIKPTGPTTDECVNVNGVDWIIDSSKAPMYRFEAYGRTPGLQVVVNSELVSGTEVVLGLNAVAKLLPQERQCTSVSDTLKL